MENKKFEHLNCLDFGERKSIKIICFLTVIVLAIFLLCLVFLSNSNNIEDAKDSVVKIVVYDEYGNIATYGSGFCAFDTNYIVTNYHVIENAHKIDFIDDNGSNHPVSKVLIFNKNTDLAILESRHELTPITIGKTKNLKAGDEVVAIGSPEGVLNTVSTGVISNADDSFEIRITAPISPGSSGGVLLNRKNQVIGITYATYNSETAQNINYAINVDFLNDMYQALLNEDFRIITTDNYKDYHNNFRETDSAELIYYSIDSLEMLKYLSNPSVFIDVDGTTYDLNEYEQCVVMRTISLSDKIWADLIYAQMEHMNFQEKAIITIMNEHGADQGGGKAYIVVPGVFVEEIDDWVFDSERKEGDITIIENHYGYSICYISKIYKS